MPKGTISEATAYERLMAAQDVHRAASALLDSRPVIVVVSALAEAVDTTAAFKSARTKLGLSQAQLGEVLGLDAPRVSGMENGKPIDKRTDLAMRALLAMEGSR